MTFLLFSEEITTKTSNLNHPNPLIKNDLLIDVLYHLPASIFIGAGYSTFILTSLKLQQHYPVNGY